MRIAVLGGSGEIGTALLKRLAKNKNFTLTAAYHTRYAAVENSNIRWIQADIFNPEEIASVIEQQDILVNCAGVSYLTSEAVARIAAASSVIYLDPFGGNYLKNSLKELNAFKAVLSSGCFPGITGFLMRYLCETAEQPVSFTGKIVQTEIPSLSGIKDFMLSGMKGFGRPGFYYSQKNHVKSTEMMRFAVTENLSVPMQLYETEELDLYAEKFGLSSAKWFTMGMNPAVLSVMQMGMMQYLRNPSESVLHESAVKIRDCFSRIPETQPGVWMEMHLQEHQKQSVLKLHCDRACELSAFMLSESISCIVRHGLPDGIHFASDLLDEESRIVLKTEFDLQEELSQC
ncbi:MAG: NAD-dependent epimerase/dehydratase family protein [Ruminococcus sp.]|nr:NAD-dependent epimerase/dehydratase family protein [Ruminococcus sp.]